jgi:predicted ATPase
MNNTKILVYCDKYLEIKTRFGQILKLSGNMNLIYGANGCGKTYLLKKIANNFKDAVYFDCNNSALINEYIINNAIKSCIKKNKDKDIHMPSFLDVINEFFYDKKIGFDYEKDEIFIENSQKERILKLSTGERAIIMVFICAMLDNHHTICLDNPEFGIHAAWQLHLVDFLQDKCKDKRFIISSHSPQVIGDHLELSHKFSVEVGSDV